MTYKIMKIASSSAGLTYWQFVLNADGSEYVTTDLAILETKLISLMVEIPISKLKVITELSITDDLTIA